MIPKARHPAIVGSQVSYPGYLVYDTFTDADSTPLASHAPEIGGAWSYARLLTTGDPSGHAIITSNALRLTTDSDGCVIDAGSADVAVSVDYTPAASADNRYGIICRYQSNGNLWEVFLREPNADILIGECTSGTFTTRATKSFTWVEGTTYSVRVVCSGNTISVYVDGVFQTSYTSSSYNTQTRFGLVRNTSTGTAQVFDNFRITDAFLTLSYPQSYQVYQRSGSTGNIYVTCSWSKALGPIEVSWSGGAYSSLVPSPAVAGSSITDRPKSFSAGQGTFNIRFKDDNASRISVPYVGIGDVFVIAGQSNASGRGQNNQSYSHATLKAGLFTNAYTWANLTDPTDSKTGQVDTVSQDSDTPSGSPWPLLATSIMASTGYPVAFIPCAMGGSAMSSWQPGADHQDRSTLYGSMIYRTLECNGALAVLWHQGEYDAAAGTTQAQYNSWLDTLADGIMDDLGISTMPCKLQNCVGRDETAINAAIAEAWSDNSNVLTGPDFSDITPDSGDGLHFYSNSQLTTAATRWWAAVEAALGW